MHNLQCIILVTYINYFNFSKAASINVEKPRKLGIIYNILREQAFWRTLFATFWIICNVVDYSSQFFPVKNKQTYWTYRHRIESVSLFCLSVCLKTFIGMLFTKKHHIFCGIQIIALYLQATSLLKKGGGSRHFGKGRLLTALSSVFKLRNFDLYRRNGNNVNVHVRWILCLYRHIYIHTGVG